MNSEITTLRLRQELQDLCITLRQELQDLLQKASQEINSRLVLIDAHITIIENGQEIISKAF
jgi:hypothetical protein